MVTKTAIEKKRKTAWKHQVWITVARNQHCDLTMLQDVGNMNQLYPDIYLLEQTLSSRRTSANLTLNVV